MERLLEFEVATPISGTTREFVFDTGHEDITVPKKEFDEAVKPGHKLHIALTSGNKKYAVTCMIETVEEIMSYDLYGIMMRPATDEEE